MNLRILVVDDSRFFRRRIAEIINAYPGLEVVDFAENGEQAISKTRLLRPDVITMDIEMPKMDGITATRKIMELTPTPIIMFSSLTTEGAKATLDALDAGAVEFIPKKFADISSNKNEIQLQLCKRIVAIGRRRTIATTPLRDPKLPRPVLARTNLAIQNPQINKHAELVAIGTSTGGPVALQKILTKLPKNFPLPILIIQHMPGTFTEAFASRLDNSCAIQVKHAKDGDQISAGVAYLAPGGYQMIVDQSDHKRKIRILNPKPTETYKPSVDVTYLSLDKYYKGKVLAIVLTGMGQDGLIGAKQLKQSGCEIWVQDEASSVVYGMPGAIVDAGIADHIFPIDRIGDLLIKKGH